jgi:hypothetical protein
MEGEDGVEPYDVFVDLGVLIVEGRIPGGAWTAGRGYGEGPHCVGVGISSLPARNDCDPNNSFLVSKKVGIIACLLPYSVRVYCTSNSWVRCSDLSLNLLAKCVCVLYPHNLRQAGTMTYKHLSIFLGIPQSPTMQCHVNYVFEKV